MLLLILCFQRITLAFPIVGLTIELFDGVVRLNNQLLILGTGEATTESTQSKYTRQLELVNTELCILKATLFLKSI